MLVDEKSANLSLQFFDEAVVRSKVRMIKNQAKKDKPESGRSRIPQFFPTENTPARSKINNKEGSW